jgi:hypothetical protein
MSTEDWYALEREIGRIPGVLRVNAGPGGLFVKISESIPQEAQDVAYIAASDAYDGAIYSAWLKKVPIIYPDI